MKGRKRYQPRKGNGNRGRSGFGADRTTFVTGHRYLYVTCAADGAAQLSINLDPTSICDDRGLVISALYRFYRFRKLRVQIWNDETNRHAFLGFSMGTITAPTHAEDLQQMSRFVMKWTGTLYPATMNLSGKDLKGSTPWWTTEGVGDPEFDTQGEFFSASVATSTGLSNAGENMIEVHYELELKEKLSNSESLGRLEKVISRLKETVNAKDRPMKVMPSDKIPYPVSHRSSIVMVNGRKKTVDEDYATV